MDDRQKEMIDKILDQLFDESDGELASQLGPEHWGMYDPELTTEDGDIPQENKPDAGEMDYDENMVEKSHAVETPLNKKKDEEEV